MTDKVSEVFKSSGQPTVTYVERDSGAMERRLNSYLDEGGQICLVTGPSKTGKTTLYKKVLEQRGDVPLVVQCVANRTAAEIWKVALEGVNFDRLSSNTIATKARTTATIEVQGEASWAWLAKLIGKGQLVKEGATDEMEVRQRVLAEPSPDHLIPVLSYTRYVLVIEDFHYLPDEEKQLLFQQWKRFIDNEITIIVLGTSHRAVDIANANKDLIGRIGQIDVKQWSPDDLKQICALGFGHLSAKVTKLNMDRIVEESVGLPILTQQICLDIFTLAGIYTVRDARKRKLQVNDQQIRNAFSEVARNRYTQFGSYFEALIRGPREKNRIYNTYELVLACFTIDPIEFALTRAEIDRRLDKVVRFPEVKPPAASINSTLGALKKFQEKRGFQLLEWRQAENMLYIVEPAFLFYVRWRSERKDTGQLDLFELLLRNIGEPPDFVDGDDSEPTAH